MARDLRCRSVKIRLTEREDEQIKNKASKANMTVARYMRESAMKKNIPAFEKKETLLALHRELSQVGNNLNQTAKQLNMYYAFDEFELKRRLGLLDNVLTKILDEVQSE